MKEKDAAAYRRIVEERRLERGKTLDDREFAEIGYQSGARGGVEAVLVPHPHTWVLEHQDLREGGERLRVVEKFGELRSIF